MNFAEVLIHLVKGENYEYLYNSITCRSRRRSCRGISIEKNEIVKPVKHFQ
ncbi:hypothetical protein ES705_49015 [subsurface metagenome]